MKESKIVWEGREMTFKYEVWQNIDFVFANVWDKHGNSHQFHQNNDGEFMCPRSVQAWTEGILVLIADVLKAETPVLIVDKPGYAWQR